MKEQLISLETAKLAKEKGFNISTDGHYALTDGLDHPFDAWITLSNCVSSFQDIYDAIDAGSTCMIRVYKSYWEYVNENGYFAPTQSLLQKWLREIHKKFVFVTAEMDSNGRIYFLTFLTDGGSMARIGESDSIFEEALEAGLQRALTLI